MNICVDVGNTEIKISFYKNDVIQNSIAVLSDSIRSEDEYFDIFERQLKTKKIELDEENDMVYSSVVPSLNRNLKNALIRLFKPAFSVDLGGKVKTSLPMKVDNPSEVGSDLIGDMVGAKVKYFAPCIVVDLGTASKILLLDKDGYFSSATIVPGLQISMDILAKKGELLPNVDLEMPEKVIARNTIDAMKVGVVMGHFEMIKGLINRYIEEIGYQPQIIITGGYSRVYKNYLPEKWIYDPDVLSIGLNFILTRNKEFNS